MLADQSEREFLLERLNKRVRKIGNKTNNVFQPLRQAKELVKDHRAVTVRNWLASVVIKRYRMEGYFSGNHIAGFSKVSFNELG